MSKLVDHLESYLGTVMHSWNQISGLRQTGVQVAQHDSAFMGAKLVLSTLGLSVYPLQSSSSGEVIYHELLLFSNAPSEPLNLPSVLAQVSVLTISSKRALVRGDILGPSGTLLEGSVMEAFFVTLPILLPPKFAATENEIGNGIALVWLLPITSIEAAWARKHGWQAFESELDRQVPDLLNWYRNEMTLE